MIKALRVLHEHSSRFYQEYGFDAFDNFKWREMSVVDVLNINGFGAKIAPGRHGCDFTAECVEHGEIKTKLASASPRFEWSRLSNPRSLLTLNQTDCFVFAVFSRLEFAPKSVWVVRNPESVIKLKQLVASRIPSPTAARDTVSVSLKEILELRHEVLGTNEL